MTSTEAISIEPITDEERDGIRNDGYMKSLAYETGEFTDHPCEFYYAETIFKYEARLEELESGLKMISRHADNQDMKHVDFRVHAKGQAEFLLKGGDA